jgi:hypothetical protein
VRSRVPVGERRAGGRRAGLRAVARDPKMGHLRPLARAAAEHGVALAVIGPGAAAPEPPAAPGWVALIGDDDGAARGPGGFDRRLRRLLERASHAAVLSGAPLGAVYALAGWVAARGGAVVLVETTERHEADWARFVERHAPGAAVLVVTPAAAGRA